MNLNEKKDLADILSKKADLIYKKIVILLAIAGGCWIYWIKFIDSKDVYFKFLGYSLFIIFLILCVGIGINYLKLNRIEKDIHE
ncbi:MAG: hypothetical protein HXX81_01410 [Campylobacterales bacterium]|nr:hypothetical protein [Campylobacterales bacterium]